MKPCPGTPFCNSLNEDTRRILCKAARRVEVPRKTIVLADFKSHLEIIQHGLIALFHLGSSLGPAPHLIAGTGDVLGIPALVDDRDWNVQMEHPILTVKCIIPHDAIRTPLEEDAQFVRALLRYFAISAVRVAHYSYMMHTQGAEQRLAHLAEILQSFSIGMNELTHERIALLTGLTRGTVTRALGVLEKSSESELKSDITDPTGVGLSS